MGALNAVWDAWNHVEKAFANSPAYIRVGCYVLVPLVIGLAGEFVFERLRRRRGRRSGESEADP